MTVDAVELCGISKRYGSTLANQDVSLALRPGTIHAIVGENGAGKTTLMRILSGAERPDAGQILVRGKVQRIGSPRDALALGIGMVHQHFLLIPALAVVENVMLGKEAHQGPFLALRRAADEVKALGERSALPVDPWTIVESLSIGQAQRVEILKVLWRGAEILILDEPTAVLAPAEARAFYAGLRALVGAGRSALVVTHKLDEVMEVADDVTVLRHGRVVWQCPVGQTTAQALLLAMFGRAVVAGEPARPRGSARGEPVLEVEGLEVEGALRGVSLSVRRGEIVGLVGLEGNGQSELILAVAGLLPRRAGQVRASAMAHVPEDRHRRGLVLGFTVEENLILGRQRTLWKRSQREPFVMQALADYGITPAEPHLPVALLSGGNQQKLVLARELGRRAPLLLVAQPSRGLDLATTELVHARLRAARDEGTGILLASSDFGEVCALADRIAVFSKGRIVGMLLPEEASVDRIAELATGAIAEAQA